MIGNNVVILNAFILNTFNLNTFILNVFILNRFILTTFNGTIFVPLIALKIGPISPKTVPFLFDFRTIRPKIVPIGTKTDRVINI